MWNPDFHELIKSDLLSMPTLWVPPRIEYGIEKYVKKSQQAVSYLTSKSDSEKL